MPIEVKWPPVISRGGSGQLYAVSGDAWIPVPEGTSQKDIHLYMTAPKILVSEQYKTNVVSQQVKGSKGNTYIVKRNSSGHWSCTCPGFGYRRRCKHVTSVASGSSCSLVKSN